MSGSLFQIFDESFKELSKLFDDFSPEKDEYFYSEKIENDNGRVKKVVNNNGKISKTENFVPVRNRLDSRLCSHESFPPTDIYANKDDGTFHIECAMAGIDKDRIEISYEDEYLTIKISSLEKSTEELYPNRVYGAKSIKTDNEYRRRIWINPKLFDANEIDYSFKDGILEIVVGKNKNYIAAKKIKVIPMKDQK